MNSNIAEMNMNTGQVVDAQFEVNLSTMKMQQYLNEVFDGWTLLKSSVVQQEYDIPREGFMSHLRTDVVTYIVRE